MYKRMLEHNLWENINNNKIVLLIGARQVGKTTVLKKISKKLQDKKESTFFINLENLSFKDLLDDNPDNIFQIIGHPKKKSYIFIDEIQYLKNPSNFLKYLYDEHHETIKLIVSGSSAFYIDKKFRDSLAGRKIIFEMHTLSFQEFLIFKNRENLIPLLKNKNIPIYNKKEILNYYNDYIRYGGYPEVVLEDDIKIKKERLEDLVDSYIKKDIQDANILHSQKYLFLLKILASQIGSLLNKHELASTVRLPVSTVENYIYLMEKSFHIATISPFFKNMRKELTKMPKVFFLDTGLRNHLLSSFDTFDLRIDRGALLENVVFRNLLNTYKKEQIQFWRTQNKQEIDFIIDEKYAYEIKVNLEGISFKKYMTFKKSYPEIPLEFIDFEKSLLL